MSDKENEIAALIVGAIKAGYKISFERNDIGAVNRHGTEVHICFLNEVVKELGDVNLSDYINEELRKI